MQRQWEKVKGGLPAPECQLRMAGKMVWNEELDKEIPEGWGAKTVKDFSTDMKSGGTPNKGVDEYWDANDYPWLKTGELKNSK